MATNAPDQLDELRSQEAADTHLARIRKRTRWHVPPAAMRINGASEGLVADLLASDAPVIAPAAISAQLDPAATREQLRQADSRLLLMSLVALTGDEGLLDRFAPYIHAQFAGGAKGVGQHAIPAEMEEELRTRIADALAGPAVTRPLGARLLQRMMSVCVGETVDAEFLPLLLEQAGFTGLQGLPAGAHVPAPAGFRVIIVGAGLSGLAVGILLTSLGYDVEIFDTAEAAGGTWHVNRYPGVGVDTPSHYYSYSFALNPDWPRFFSKGDALRAYFVRVAQDFGLNTKINYETRVKSCTWDDDAKVWDVVIQHKDGVEQTRRANVVVPAISYTNQPETPPFPGLECFAGDILHSAAWKDDIQLAGKRVAVIGTGASSMQLSTTIAPEVGQLTVFQRTPHWILPNPLANAQVPDGARWALRHVPHYAQWQRLMTYWAGSDNVYPLAVVDPHWHMPDLSVSEPSEKRRQLLLAYIASELEGRPDLIDKVTPQYPPMGKRIILDSGWYKMLRRDNVALEAAGIDHIEPDAIVTRDGRRIEVDAIVMATGFRFRPMLASLDITGRDGMTLAEAWQDEDPRAYMGVLAPHFPNLFIVNGPNAAPNHGAGANLVSEATANYIAGLLDLLVQTGARSVEASEAATAQYNAALDETLSHMVWNHPRASSYYINRKRRNTVTCPWRLVDYWWMMRQPKAEDLVLSD